MTKNRFNNKKIINSMFCKNIKLDGVKKTFLTIFSVAVLAFGFGALNVPEAEAFWSGTFDGGTITSTSRDNVSMCTTNASNFTVVSSTTPLVGVDVAFTVTNEKTGVSTLTSISEKIGSCKTIEGGICEISSFTKKIKGDVVVTVGGKSVNKVIEAVKWASKEDEASGQCYDDCDNNWGFSSNTGKDCADSDCSGKTCYKGTQKGTCGAVSKACDISTEVLNSITADKNPITVGSPIVITFTTNINDVKITPTVTPASSSTFSPADCVTGVPEAKKCSITVTPISAGTITITAFNIKVSAETETMTISVNAADAIKIGISPSVKNMTAGKSVKFDFVIRDKDNKVLPGAVISFSGANVSTSDRTTDSSGEALGVVLYPTSEGTITIKASAAPLVSASISIPVLPAGATGGTGVGGLTTASLSEIIGRMIDWLLSVAAGLAVLFMIIGGVYYVTAAGNDAQIETAKKMIAYSIIGLVFVIVSYSIVVTINSIITG